MFEILYLMFSWLPSPLNVIAFGAVCIVLVLAVIRVIVLVFDLIPFL